MNLKEVVKNIAKKMNGEVSTSILIKRGMKVGENFNRQQGSYLDPTHCFLIEIGDNVTFSIRVTILAHDASTKKSIGYTKIGKVIIGNNVFVGANTTILPNVVIGDDVIIGANSVVTKNIPDNCVAAGNPAKVICSIEEFRQHNAIKMESTRKFGKEYRFSKNLTEQKKKEIREAVQQGIAYID